MSAADRNRLRALFIEAFALADRHADVWLRHFNAAITAAGGTRGFAAHERQLAMTHWAMLTAIAAAWMEEGDPFAPPDDADAFAGPVMTLGELHTALGGRYTPTTVRKNFIELKHLGLLQQRGRGEGAKVHLHHQALIAVRETVLEWLETHAALARRLAALRG